MATEVEATAGMAGSTTPAHLGLDRLTAGLSLRTAIVVVTLSVAVLAISVSTLVMLPLHAISPMTFVVRLAAAAASCLIGGTLVARLTTTPLRGLEAALCSNRDARTAAAAVRASATSQTRELRRISISMARLLETIATRADALEAQQLALMTANAGLNVERRRLLRLERQRDASEALLDAVVRHLPEALVVLDPNHRVRLVSQAASDLFGFTPDQAHDLDFTRFLAPRDHGRVLAEAAAQTGRIEIGALRDDGAEFPAELTLSRIATQRGAYLAMSIRDLAHDRQVEAESRQAQKLESVGRLASGVAHEINTPVQFVGDSAHFLRDAWRDVQGLLVAYRGELASDGVAVEVAERIAAAEETADVAFLETEIPAALDRILDGVDRVAKIVRAMKEFAHAESAEQTSTDLNHALATTLTLACNETKYVANVETDFGELPPVMCHVGELNQVFLNLVINAAHAIQDAGKLADGERGAIRVATRVDADGAMVTISISDDGCGIPDAIRAKIFDPFFTTKEVGRGSGQGLAIARSVVVDKHGGTITLDTTVGVGTTFHVRVPVAGRPTATAATA